MDKNLLHEAIGKAIKSASGKSFADAQRIITEAAWGLIEPPPADTFVLAENSEPETPEIPPSIVRPTARIANLRPVGAPLRSVVRQIWTADQIQEQINLHTPDELSFVPENTDKEAHLQRIVTVDTNTPPTIQLTYRPNSSDPDIPYPKKMLFTTDETWDWPAIMDKITSDAASMYRLRTQPIRTTKVSNGGRVTFGNKAEV